MSSRFTAIAERLRQPLSHQQLGVWLRGNQPLLVLLAIAASLAMGIGVGRHTTRSTPSPAAAPAETPGRADAVTLSEEQLRRSGFLQVRPERSTGSERPISGFVEAAVGARSTVGMPVAGRITRVLVAPGIAIRAGQVIAEVSSPEAAAVHAEAEAARATAQSLAYQYRLAMPMARQGALSAQEFESRRIASVTAATQARAAAAKAVAVGSPDANGRLQIRSPIDGRIAAVTASPGAVLQTGDAVAEISDAAGSELRFLVSPLLGAALESGQMLRVKAGPRDLRARVLAVAPDSASGNRVSVVRAEVVDSPMPPAGTAVTAFVMVPSSQERFTVPADALAVLDGSPVVFRYQRGVIEPLPVVVGETSAGRVVILQGLRGGEQLLAGNTEIIRSALAGRSRPAPR